MSISCDNWSNKGGTAERDCSCGSWKDHWLKITGKPWPSVCAVSECTAPPVLGAHVYHADVTGERIVPMCDSCNKKNRQI
ncbi:hypothetical protein DaDZ19_06650 [Dickeya ananatis]